MLESLLISAASNIAVTVTAIHDNIDGGTTTTFCHGADGGRVGGDVTCSASIDIFIAAGEQENGEEGVGRVGATHLSGR